MTFTLDQLRNDRARVVRAAKSASGCVIIDDDGRQLFTLWIPQTPCR